jgi:penicillin-binding protein 2
VPPGFYNFSQALFRSSNSYFISNGITHGIENILQVAHRAHFGELIGLPTRQEARGSLPSEARIHSGWTDGDTANICIGQGELDVTPLQMTVFASALANGGEVLYPRLVDRIEPQDALSGGPVIVTPKHRVRDNLGVSRRSLDILEKAMLQDTENPEGTGVRARCAELRICGKTGTAENQDASGQTINDTTWFMSFAPYGNPRYAVVVMVEHGSSGGGTCAPIAKMIYEEGILKSEKQHAKPNTSNLAQAR